MGHRKNQCMNFLCCWCLTHKSRSRCAGTQSEAAQGKWSLAARTSTPANSSSTSAAPIATSRKPWRQRKNFEAGVHPAGRGKKQQQKKPSPQAAAPKQHQQQQQQHKPPHKKPKPQAPPPKKSQVAPTPLAMERPAAPPPAPPALEATSNKKSDSNVLRAKALADARATLSKVGLIDLLTSVNATSEHQLLSASAFCQAEGVTEVMDIATYNLLDDFIASLGDKLGRASEGKLRAKIEASGQDARQRREAGRRGTRKVREESSFYFVPAATLRASDEETLPRFQELKARGKEWLIRLDVPWKAACRGEFAQKILAVSHRWETHSTPTKGVQLAEIRSICGSTASRVRVVRLRVHAAEEQRWRGRPIGRGGRVQGDARADQHSLPRRVRPLPHRPLVHVALLDAVRGVALDAGAVGGGPPALARRAAPLHDGRDTRRAGGLQ